MKFVFFFCLLLAAHAQADQDSEFLSTRDAFRAGDAAKFER